MNETPHLAKSYKISGRYLAIDGVAFPFLIHEDGPRIEPAFDGMLTTLWVPIIIDKPCPNLGAPEGATPIQIEEIEAPNGERWSIEHHDHKPVQHRDGLPPWCNACGFTTDWTHHTQLRRQG
ncbi:MULTISPECIES: hypothetical protein [unclassified Leucobacter]|uniref:hypothetical protein n=1 Tax=unclassified Leucobacter TaxID=2621730 RepID=UPI00062283AF|nr:hypothetical protein [Leucobacter sp. Ag1]KKI16382.1 hypothetical protein XM48_16440 [Leucobacter sp. Ag1]